MQTAFLKASRPWQSGAQHGGGRRPPRQRPCSRLTSVAAARASEPQPFVASPGAALQTPRAVLRSCCPLHQAIVQNDPAALENALHLATQPWLEPNGQRPITLAALLGRASFVERLLATGSSASDTDFFGHSALHWAQLTQQPELTSLLLQHGAPTDGRNFLGGTPTDCAAQVAPAPAGRTLRVVQGAQVQIWSAAQVQQRLGLQLLDTTKIDSSWLSQLVSVMANDDLAERVLRFLPRAALPEGPEPAVALKHYGPVLKWGVCALAPIQAGSFVGSYTGRLVALAPGEQDFNPYLATPLCAGPLSRLRIGIDARHAGNWVSRINSASGPENCNLLPQEGWRAGLPVLDLVAARPIAAGEQLLWDYGQAYWQQHAGARL